MTTDELIAYYQNLLIIQYATQSRALATISAFVTEAISDQIIQSVEDGFDLTTAIGVQLDAIATYRGASRALYNIDLGKEYFQMPSYDDPDPDADFGFALYGDDPSWFFITYEDAAQPTYYLNDAELRLFIQYLADVQSAYLGLGTIDTILYKYFGTYLTYTDNLDMSVTIHHDTSDPGVLFKIVDFTSTFPRPSGVAVTVT